MCEEGGDLNGGHSTFDIWDPCHSCNRYADERERCYFYAFCILFFILKNCWVSLMNINDIFKRSIPYITGVLVLPHIYKANTMT